MVVVSYDNRVRKIDGRQEPAKSSLGRGWELVDAIGRRSNLFAPRVVNGEKRKQKKCRRKEAEAPKSRLATMPVAK